MRRLRIKNVVTIVLLALLFWLVANSGSSWDQFDPLVYSDSLELTAAQMNGQELTLKDLAYYVGYEEYAVEQDATAYDPDNTKKYWNMYTPETGFMDLYAQDTAMDMALHDTLFAQMASADGIVLTDEEEQHVDNALADFWEDLTERGGEEALGITEEDARQTIEQIAYAQKYQAVYAELHGKDSADYDYTEEAYQELLKEQDYKVYDKVWKRVDFGSVTLNH